MPRDGVTQPQEGEPVLGTRPLHLSPERALSRCLSYVLGIWPVLSQDSTWAGDSEMAAPGWCLHGNLGSNGLQDGGSTLLICG